MPRELAYALRVSIDGLRPWEFDGFDSDRYEEIAHLQAAFRDQMAAARKREQAAADARSKRG